MLPNWSSLQTCIVFFLCSGLPEDSFLSTERSGKCHRGSELTGALGVIWCNHLLLQMRKLRSRGVGWFVNTEPVFQSPWRMGWRLHLLKTHPCPPTVQKWEPTRLPMVYLTGVIWLLLGVTNFPGLPGSLLILKWKAPHPQKPPRPLAIWEGWARCSCLHLHAHLSPSADLLMSQRPREACFLFLEHTGQTHSHLGPLHLLHPLSESHQVLVSLTCHPGLVLARHATLLITWLQISCVYYSTPVMYVFKNHLNCCYG